MFGSNVLDIAIGIVFIYLMFSLVCTAVNEWIASVLNQRGKNLFEGIANLLNDPTFTGLAQLVYSHGLVEGTSEDAADSAKPNRLPSYMDSKTFSLVLMNILRAHGPDPNALLRERLANIRQKYPDRTKSPGTAINAAADQVETALNTLTTALTADPANPDQIDSARQDLLARQKALDTVLQAQSVPAAGEGRFIGLLTKLMTRFGLSESGKTFYSARGRVANDLLLVPELEKVLATGLTAAAQKETDGDAALQNIQNAVISLPPGHTRESLLSLLDKTRRDVKLLVVKTDAVADTLQTFQKNLDDWYNSSMDRVGGWYKRWTQKVLLFLSIVFVVLLNVDTLMLYNRLSSDKELRNSIATAAQNTVKDVKIDATNSNSNQLRSIVQQEADTLQLPFGWSTDKNAPNRVPGMLPEAIVAQTSSTSMWVNVLYLGGYILGSLLLKVIGLGLSAFAISLGAPFWFDTLSKIVNLRGAGTPPGDTKKNEKNPIK